MPGTGQRQGSPWSTATGERASTPPPPGTAGDPEGMVPAARWLPMLREMEDRIESCYLSSDKCMEFINGLQRRMSRFSDPHEELAERLGFDLVGLNVTLVMFQTDMYHLRNSVSSLDGAASIALGRRAHAPAVLPNTELSEQIATRADEISAQLATDLNAAAAAHLEQLADALSPDLSAQVAAQVAAQVSAQLAGQLAVQIAPHQADELRAHNALLQRRAQDLTAELQRVQALQQITASQNGQLLARNAHLEAQLRAVGVGIAVADDPRLPSLLMPPPPAPQPLQAAPAQMHPVQAQPVQAQPIQIRPLQAQQAQNPLSPAQQTQAAHMQAAPVQAAPRQVTPMQAALAGCGPAPAAPAIRQPQEQPQYTPPVLCAPSSQQKPAGP